MKRNRKQSGFTLIEILVVVVMIGVLAGLVVPKLFSKIGKAKSGVAIQKIAAIDSAISYFRIEYERYPQSLDELVEQPSDIPSEKWSEPTIKARDLKDPWGNDFIYVYPGNNGAYDLMSYGADGQAGGEKENADITNWE